MISLNYLTGVFVLRLPGTLLLAGITATLPSHAAAEIRMICENVRREYVVTFDASARSLSADSTDYEVLAIEENADRLVVAGLTTRDGPTVKAHFRPYRRIDYFANGELFQTDGCRF